MGNKKQSGYIKIQFDLTRPEQFTETEAQIVANKLDDFLKSQKVNINGTIQFINISTEVKTDQYAETSIADKAS